MWMFVYGTLRPGHYNYPVIASAVTATETGTTSGRLYHVEGGSDMQPIYPVADFDQEGTITGDLLHVDASSVQVRRTNRMEEGAGYEPRWLEVTTSDGSTVKALAWHYPYETGPRIETGDWNDLFSYDDNEGDD